jgi:hypothetical protein
VYYIVRNYARGPRYWDERNVTWRADRGAATAYSTREASYLARRRLGPERSTVISAAGAEIAELVVETCPTCGQTRVR